jgi:hypothetical protein
MGASVQGGDFFVFELKRARSPDHAIGTKCRGLWG